MCTAISLSKNGEFFGRTLDLEFSLYEKVVVIPRNFDFKFRYTKNLSSHYAIIGMATVKNEYPLLYDATNEYGLSIAALNFPQNAVYSEKTTQKPNVAVFEFIPFILGRCKTVGEAVKLIKNINIIGEDFDENLKTTPLHWLISDRKSSVTVEPLESGIEIYENNVGVLTNNPPFSYHLTNLSNYMSLSVAAPKNSFSKELNLINYSRGMGALGLPGDNSSASRFVRAAFLKYNALPFESSGVELFFRIMSGVEQTKGIVRLSNGENVISVYTSCCDTENGIYYYKTYEGGFGAVKMKNCNLNSCDISIFELQKQPTIHFAN